MTNVEAELKSRSIKHLKLMKEEMNINNKLKRKIIESTINDNDLIISRKFSELLKSRLESKSVSI